MPSIAGEAAVRIVPSLKGFHAEAERKIKAKRITFDVYATANTAVADKQLDAWRVKQQANPLNLHVRTDLTGLKRDLSEVRHIFERNNLVKGIRFNIKVIGLDALPAIAYAAGSAASGLDALAKSAFILPGAFSAAGASIGAFALGIQGVGDAFKAHSKDAKDAAKSIKDVRDAQRDLERAQKDVTTAVRDQRRELEDLNAELRRASLDEADALLNLQESADRLKQGGFKSITEYQRAQVRYLRDIESLKDVRKNNIRLLEDTNAANEKGITQGDKVVSAIDKVTDAVDRLNEAQSKTGNDFAAAMGKLSPNAQSFVNAVYGMKGAWDGLRMSVQDNLFAGLDRELATVGTRVIPGLKIGLSQVASGLNANIKSVVDSIGSGKNQDFFSRIFGNTQGGLENFKRGLDPLITGLSRMASVSSSFLPRLGDAFANVMEKFDKWTARISADGSLQRWIDQGLNSLVSLGNLAKNLVSIISSVGEAFNTSSGTEGGFIGFFERKTKELSTYLKGEGKAVLVGYFNRARELIRTVSKSFGDMKPLIRDIVDAARNFSTVLLPVVGTLAKITTWVEKHTGVVKTLFYAYAAYRTVRPIIDGVKGAWENYIKVVGALSRFGPTANHFQSVNTGLTKMRSHLSAVSGVAAGASSTLKPLNVQLNQTGQQLKNLFTPSQNMITSLNNVGTAATGVKNKVGTSAGARAGTLLGALGGLASFIGPAIGAGVLGIALGAGIEGLFKLEDAHNKAKEAADRQAESLGGLRDALDDVTGAATGASLKRGAEVFQNFDMGPVVGTRNILEDVVRAGIATPDQLLAATLPQNQSMANDIDRKAIDQAAAKIEQSETWKKYGDRWAKGGVTPRDLALAAKDDPAAMDKVAAAEKEQFGKARRDWNQLDRASNSLAAKQLPSVADVIVSTGIQDEASVALGLAKAREQNVTSGGLIQQATRAAGGPTGLTPAGVGMFGKFGASNNEAYLNPEHTIGTLVVTSDPGEIDPEVGQVTKLNDKQWKIELTADATKKFMSIPQSIPQYARGGLIQGRGTGTSDSNLMLASTGEFIARKAAVDHYGAGFFQRLNAMQLPKFAPGGEIPPPILPWDQVASNALTAAGFTASPAALPAVPDPIYGPYPVDASLSDPNSATMRAPGGVVPFGGTVVQPPSPAPSAGAQGAALGNELLAAAEANFAPPSAPPPAPKPAAPKPAGPKPAAPAAVPHTGSGAAPGPAAHNGTGALPGPVQTAGQSMAGNVMALSRATGIPPQLLMRFMPAGAMGAGRVPYAGLKAGTNIPYGAAGFPDWVYKVAQRFGLQASTYAGHQEGSGVNKGIDWSGPVENMRAFAEYVRNVPGMEQVIFQDPRDGTQIGVDPGDRGANQSISDYYANDWKDHLNHVHTRISSSIPTPEELAAGGGIFGVNAAAGIPGMSFPGLIPGGIADGNANPFQKIANYFTGQEWLKQDNVNEFLAGQANTVGSSLLNIGMGFLQGITGLDFSSFVNTGQQIGNFVLGAGKDGKDGEVNTDFTDLNAMTNDEIAAYMNGDLSLGMGGGLDAALGQYSSILGGLTSAIDTTGISASYNPGGGAEQWRPVVRRVLETYASQYGIKNVKAWEDAIVKQIDTESKGDPGADNPTDSNGQGGTQHVAGLLQFLPETFAANNITGGSYLDPVAQIAAVIPYVLNKYGVNADGSPKQIGMGIGYARGGRIRGVGGPRADKNLIRVSRGEFLHNANAVNYYGTDFLSRLNNRQIPKSALPGFADGMWWNPQEQQPAPPPPAPAAGVDGQVSGPMPSVADAAPSTGGAPGPGATAPAPDPGALPQVNDALAGLGSIGDVSGGLAQPGASGDTGTDPRATLGAPPASQNHNSPVVSGAISGLASAIGSAASLAASAGAAAGTMGASAAIPGAGGAAGAGIQAGAQMAGQIATGAVNILSSFLVGTATGGSTANPYGVPMLPQRQPMQTGVPALGQQKQYQDNRTYNLTNLDEYKRLQERDAAQNTMPFIGRF